jgi:hypothetical protein
MKGKTKAIFRIECEKADIEAQRAVEAAEPYRFEGLLLRPAEE